jgi:hypothetical protein
MGFQSVLARAIKHQEFYGFGLHRLYAFGVIDENDVPAAQEGNSNRLINWWDRDTATQILFSAPGRTHARM